MVKVPPMISYYLLLILVFTVEIRVTVGRTCRIASLGCVIDSVCNQQCISRYNGRGGCYRPPGTYLMECLCLYPC
ncbi:hypothetical protein GIB67_033573 [Kingdonia uniflora]|uniref:Defensin-like protein n=1 Tax=Kingdonia uniflora TaxID=39325 RepID=A0A7J7L6I9_9MAGN|nr:hypothetical protein GIB67_033573 [Kingdonia uniflora]